MDNDQKDNNNDWNFELDEEKLLQVENNSEKPEDPPKKVREKKLILEKPKVNNAKSRASLYEELETANKKSVKDIIVLAPIITRLISFIIDLAIMGAIFILSFKLLKYNYILSDQLMEKYKLKWDVSESLVGSFFICLNFLIIYSLSFIYPTLFYNGTIGKLLTGLRVRGSKDYSLSLFQVVSREMIYKPLSLIFLIGIVFPFFNKNRKSIHDYLSDTLVIAE